ncbi:ankyrin repeat domain-containing protein [Candidatus Uabimicrobium amorphum]|uniref:Ankryin n=1 Tax=Uabimicrobium amorphum TaxID=2596890 RepID=A0A5S9F5D7_UABAM|nr:ankyrin repeat domain-containing protein [Candidatus Uabimicrobium amorphum]BBM86492.1 hypothetical protein UABAM_04878 [Candidatus Uabimicrobium amorphum]
MDMFELIKNADLETLQNAISLGGNPQIRNNCGDTLLSVASGNGQHEVVEYLCELGIELHITNDFGFTALSSALWCSHMNVANYLVSKGAKINVECAAALGNIDALEKNLSKITSIEDMVGAYLLACRCGQLQVIQWFLDQKMPIDLHPPGSEWGGIGCPGLHHAVENGHIAAVKLLLENGADFTLVDDVYQSNALAWAAGAGNREITMLLREAGASVSQRNSHGLNAIDLAEEYGFSELAQQLKDSS